MFSFDSIREDETIPMGSKMERSEPSNPPFVFNFFFPKQLIPTLSVFTFHNILNAYELTLYHLV